RLRFVVEIATFGKLQYVSGNGRTTPTDRQTPNQTTPTDTEKIKSPPHRIFLADTHLAHWQVVPSPPTTQTCQRAKFSNRTQTLSRTEKQNEPYNKVL
ncbi:MAG: hypothetical protein RML38_04755, partial [Bacteroidia bacterium]|nr:hypothetical protein [Bacteroidia bacterium]